jgi:hypothetical protein
MRVFFNLINDNFVIKRGGFGPRRRIWEVFSICATGEGEVNRRRGRGESVPCATRGRGESPERGGELEPRHRRGEETLNHVVREGR